MKTLITLALIIISISVYSQKSVLKLKNGDVRKVTIISTSPSSLSIQNENIMYSEIDTLILPTIKPFQEEMKKKFTDAGIVVIVSQSAYDDANVSTVPKSSIVKTMPSDTEPNINQPFINYRKEAMPARIVQVLGAAALTVGFILQKQQYDDAASGKITKSDNTPFSLQIAGGSALFLGIILDMNAMRSFKIRIKH